MDCLKNDCYLKTLVIKDSLVSMAEWAWLYSYALSDINLEYPSCVFFHSDKKHGCYCAVKKKKR